VDQKDKSILTFSLVWPLFSNAFGGKKANGEFEEKVLENGKEGKVNFEWDFLVLIF
jgi:hypothetical protein